MSTEDRYLMVVNVDGPEEYKVHVDGENYFFTSITSAVEKFLEKYEDDLRHDEILKSSSMQQVRLRRYCQVKLSLTVCK